MDLGPDEQGSALNRGRSFNVNVEKVVMSGLQGDDDGDAGSQGEYIPSRNITPEGRGFSTSSFNTNPYASINRNSLPNINPTPKAANRNPTPYNKTFNISAPNLSSSQITQTPENAGRRGGRADSSPGMSPPSFEQEYEVAIPFSPGQGGLKYRYNKTAVREKRKLLKQEGGKVSEESKKFYEEVGKEGDGR